MDREHAEPDVPVSGRGRRLAIVVADYHLELAEAMVEAASERAKELEFAVGPLLRVTGSYDAPLVADAALRLEDVVGVVVLGAIVTGGTRHDELIGHATARSLHAVSLARGKPVGLGITGPGQTLEEAEARVHRAADAVTAVARMLAAVELAVEDGG